MAAIILRWSAAASSSAWHTTARLAHAATSVTRYKLHAARVRNAQRNVSSLLRAHAWASASSRLLSVSQRALEVVSVGGRHRKEHRPDAGKRACSMQSALNAPKRREQQQRTHQSAQSATLAARLSLYVVLL